MTQVQTSNRFQVLDDKAPKQPKPLYAAVVSKVQTPTAGELRSRARFDASKKKEAAENKKRARSRRSKNEFWDRRTKSEKRVGVARDTRDYDDADYQSEFDQWLNTELFKMAAKAGHFRDMTDAEFDIVRALHGVP